jgi:hypothetical protein
VATTNIEKGEMKVTVTYAHSSETEIELPASKTWDNVDGFTFDGDTRFLILDDGTRLDFKEDNCRTIDLDVMQKEDTEPSAADGIDKIKEAARQFAANKKVAV